MSFVGVGIVSYNDPLILDQSLEAVINSVPASTPIVVYDDASWAANSMIWRKYQNRIEVLRSPVNRGSAHGRNAIWEWAFLQNHYTSIDVNKWCPYLLDRVVTMDMDILVHPGWLDALMAVMDNNPNCGIATFKYGNDHGGHFPVHNGNMIAESASMCWLLRRGVLEDMLGPDFVWGMDERMEIFSHDSEMSQRMKRCSKWRMYVAEHDLISEIASSHSIKFGCSKDKEAAIARRDKDFAIWAELEATRGWVEGKTDV